MRISDWSSDVCSSDLPLMRRNELDQPFRERRLSRAGSARNQDILAALDRLLEKFDVLSCVEQIAQFNIERRDLPSCDLCLAKQPTALEVLHRQRHRCRDRKSTRLNSSHKCAYRMLTSA